MVEVVSVRFRTAGKLYYFDPTGFDIVKGNHVIVETARGMEYGTVVGDKRQVEEENIVRPLKPIIRIATKEDDEMQKENLLIREDAYKICKEKISKHQLPMKLVEAEYTFDRKKLMFYFTADNRIDFRELVKDLAAVFKTRIELRQIGVRDEIKLLGGVGMCGREFCCHSYLHEFAPVSIKMAKEQNLSLNPANVSGVCGRLMCCLKNEEETYEELNKSMPNVGDNVGTSDGLRGEVISVNVLRQKVKLLIENGDEKEIKEYNASELRFKKNGHKDKEILSDEDKKALELLEEQEREDILEIQNEQEEERRENRHSGERRDNEKKHFDKKKDFKNSDNRPAKKDKKEWQDKSDKSDKKDRPEKNEKHDKSDKQDRHDKKNFHRNRKNGNNPHNNHKEGRPKQNGEQ